MPAGLPACCFCGALVVEATGGCGGLAPCKRGGLGAAPRPHVARPRPISFRTTYSYRERRLRRCKDGPLSCIPYNGSCTASLPAPSAATKSRLGKSNRADKGGQCR